MRNLFTALMLTFYCAVNAQTGDKNFIDQNYIEVIGKAEMEVAPDMIYLKVLLNEKDTKNKIPVSELEAKMIEKLKSIGIDVTKDLLIKDISSNFKYYLLTKSEILLSKEYQILVHDGKTASQVFIELENIGLSNVSIDRLENSKIVQFRNEVKVSAIKAAKEKAGLLASAISQGVGRALFIQEVENNLNSRASNNIMMRNANSYGVSGSSKIMDFDFEKIKIEYSILCRFELK